MRLNISVYGVGNFGYAILKHLDKKRDQGLYISAFDRDPHITETIIRTQRHPYLHKSIAISDYVHFVSSPQKLLQDCDVLVLAVSSDATREVLSGIKEHFTKPIIILNTAKALDQQTGKRLSEIVSEELPEKRYTYAALAGGTIAKDLFSHEPLGVDIACENAAAAMLLKGIFQSDNLSVYTTPDVLGVEYAGAYKNIIAILAGIIKGLGFSYGAETRIISRTAHVIGLACVQQGASPETFSIGSQCWGNDLWMSATGNTRNREFGILLGKGMNPRQAVAHMTSEHKTIEGYNTLKIVSRLPSMTSIKTVQFLCNVVIDETRGIDTLKEHLLSVDSD